MKSSAYVYILMNVRDTVLYVGVTSDLVKRVTEHKRGVVEGFTKKYRLKKLVYYEVFPDVREAIRREKQLKNWRRRWKLELREGRNPDYRDLYEEIV